MKMTKWFWIIYIIVLTTTSTLLIRQLTIQPSWWLLLLIGAVSLAAFWGYYQLFKYGQVGISYALITGSVILFVALGAKYFYKETWSWWTYLGLTLVIAGILVLGFQT